MRTLNIRSGAALWTMVLWTAWWPAGAADAFTVATYNLENYRLDAQGAREAKSAESRAVVCESIKTMAPDVLALQEVGGKPALTELRAALEKAGLKYPEAELLVGPDVLINVAVLSKFPIIARRPHTEVPFLLNGRRFKVSRGFAEVDIRVNSRYAFTLLTTHLKSRRPVPTADESDLREQEAVCLREIIDARLQQNPELNLIVAGDLNDVKGSPSVRVVMGQGRSSLLDTRPAERYGDLTQAQSRGYYARNITWTYFYAKEDNYSRIDFILVSHGMAKEWNRDGGYVLNLPNWGSGSDHRPIMAEFIAADR